MGLLPSLTWTDCFRSSSVPILMLEFDSTKTKQKNLVQELGETLESKGFNVQITTNGKVRVFDKKSLAISKEELFDKYLGQDNKHKLKKAGIKVH